MIAARFGDHADRRAAISRRRRHLIERSTRPGDLVAVPANASRDLVDDVKASGRMPRFAPVDAQGAPTLASIPPVAAVWIQAIAGIVPEFEHSTRPGPIQLIDAGDTLAGSPHPRVASTRVEDLNGRAAIDDQRRNYGEVVEGIVHAAGLDVIDPWRPSTRPPDSDARVSPVPTGVVVQLPAGADPVTFAAFARAEFTGIEWLPLRRPLHPQARHHLAANAVRASIDHLARLLIVPVGPTMTDEEIGHAVLGIVKTAEYTGWRWFTDRDRARWYVEWLDDRYGRDHEAYRPAFPLDRTPT